MSTGIRITSRKLTYIIYNHYVLKYCVFNRRGCELQYLLQLAQLVKLSSVFEISVSTSCCGTGPIRTAPFFVAPPGAQKIAISPTDGTLVRALALATRF